MSNEEEGYWAPPNAQHLVKYDEPPIGTEAIKAAFLSWESDQDRDLEIRNIDLVEASVRSMGQSFGLRDFKIRRITNESPLMEVKPSINQPEKSRAYYTMRYRLVVTDHISMVNLVDSEGRYGFVALPLVDNLDDYAPSSSDPNRTGQPCRFFLGKPTMSGVNRLLERPNASSDFRRFAIDVSGRPTIKKLRGLVAVADVSGYGAVLNAKYTAGLIAPNYARADYRKNVLSTLKSTLVALGTTQVQSAGDGFVAGFPLIVSQDRDNLLRPAENWRRCATSIEENINERLALAEMPAPPRVGSRMALGIGNYSWGRINGISSFCPAFEGGVVISAARLEQGLNAAVNEGRALASSDGSDMWLKPRGHYLALSGELAECLGVDRALPGWTHLGQCVLSSKRQFEPWALLFECTPVLP